MGFSWTLEMSNRQNEYHEYHVVLGQNSFIEFFLQTNKFYNLIKKCHCRLSKSRLHYQTVIDQRLTARVTLRRVFITRLDKILFMTLTALFLRVIW